MPESPRLVEYYYQRFVRAGARLSEADKTTLKALNEQDASLSAKYISQLLDATKDAALVVGRRQRAGRPLDGRHRGRGAGRQGARPRAASGCCRC